MGEEGAHLGIAIICFGSSKLRIFIPKVKYSVVIHGRFQCKILQGYPKVRKFTYFICVQIFEKNQEIKAKVIKV